MGTYFLIEIVGNSPELCCFIKLFREPLYIAFESLFSSHRNKNMEFVDYDSCYHIVRDRHDHTQEEQELGHLSSTKHNKQKHGELAEVHVNNRVQNDPCIALWWNASIRTRRYKLHLQLPNMFLSPLSHLPNLVVWLSCIWGTTCLSASKRKYKNHKKNGHNLI